MCEHKQIDIWATPGDQREVDDVVRLRIAASSCKLEAAITG